MVKKCKNWISFIFVNRLLGYTSPLWPCPHDQAWHDGHWLAAHCWGTTDEQTNGMPKSMAEQNLQIWPSDNHTSSSRVSNAIQRPSEYDRLYPWNRQHPPATVQSWGQPLKRCLNTHTIHKHSLTHWPAHESQGKTTNLNCIILCKGQLQSVS